MAVYNKTGNVHKRNNEARSLNQRCRGKAIRVTYSGCVFVALVTQHVMHMRCTVLSSVVCASLQYFSTFSRERHDFRGEKIIQYKMCVFICSTNLSETFLILRIIQRDMIHKVYCPSCKVHVIPVAL